MDRPILRPRLLLIEDDPDRISTFERWLEDTGIILIKASSGGRAMGMLRKGMTEGISGICLDHDLEKQPVTDDDLRLSGSQLITSITQTVDRSVPILIHSMNAQKPAAMQRALQSAHFSVTRIRYASLTRELFIEWLDAVRDSWEDKYSLE